LDLAPDFDAFCALHKRAAGRPKDLADIAALSDD
jgi:hypothetical protein